MTLEDIRARAEKATPGPWELAGGNEWLSPLGIDVGSEDESSRPTLLAKDADFIAHARTDIPRLLAALDAVLDVVDGFWLVEDQMILDAIDEALK